MGPGLPGSPLLPHRGARAASPLAPYPCLWHDRLVAYTSRHKLLTVFGTSWGGVETWSFGMRFLPTSGNEAVTQAQANACATPVSTFWSTSSAGMPGSYALTGVKLAPIGTDGKYPPGEIPYISAIGPTNGPGATPLHVPQASTVVTFLASLTPRGRGSRGRVYLPPYATAMAANGTMGTSVPGLLLAAFRTMVLSLNAVSNLGTLVIMSDLGTGITSNVTSLRCDNVYDTQRRRRRQIIGAKTDLAI